MSRYTAQEITDRAAEITAYAASVATEIVARIKRRRDLAPEEEGATIAQFTRAAVSGRLSDMERMSPELVFSLRQEMDFWG